MNRERCRVFTTRIVATLLLAILSVYYINSTMFSHTHTIDGATITHSHFYDDSHTEGDDCKHTEGELTLIQHLNNIITLKSDTLYIAEVCFEVEYTIFIPLAVNDVDAVLHSKSAPRAPPQFFV